MKSYDRPGTEPCKVLLADLRFTQEKTEARFPEMAQTHSAAEWLATVQLQVLTWVVQGKHLESFLIHWYLVPAPGDSNFIDLGCGPSIRLFLVLFRAHQVILMRTYLQGPRSTRSRLFTPCRRHARDLSGSY